MNIGNRIGIVSSVLLTLAVIGGFVFPVGGMLIGGIVGNLALLGLIFAGIRGSRWWLLLPALVLVVWIWAINQGV
jgi:hypothetical protein